MATINMHVKCEIEIPKQTWLMLRKPCRLQTDGRTDGPTDGRTDKVNPVYPPSNFVGRGYKDETFVRPSHLYNGNTYTGKMASLYWDCPWAWSQYKDHLSRYRDSYYKDETIFRPSNLYNGNPYIGKMTSLYWDSPQIAGTLLNSLNVVSIIGNIYWIPWRTAVCLNILLNLLWESCPLKLYLCSISNKLVMGYCFAANRSLNVQRFWNFAINFNVIQIFKRLDWNYTYADHCCFLWRPWRTVGRETRVHFHAVHSRFSPKYLEYTASPARTKYRA